MRPSISLCCILKNEVDNIPQLLKSVRGCFDEIHFTDTGSTDGSIELIKSIAGQESNIADSKIFLHHFDWIHDFSAARNASFSHAFTDYIAWLDLDDILSDAKAFIDWRDNIMEIGDFWLATYHYSSTEEGKPVCSFARERVVKRDKGFTWKYFVHEGMAPTVPNISMQYVTNWNVVHKRTAEDFKKDKSRNLAIFEKQKDPLDVRMLYYYGKELFENQKPLEAFGKLKTAIASPDLELHDRTMGIQYAAMCAMQLNQYDMAIQLSHSGCQLDPMRAEYYVIIGDSHLKMNRHAQAIPYYAAASRCQYKGDSLIKGATFNHEDSYRHYPLNQMARIYANLGNVEAAEKVANEALAIGSNIETEGILKDLAALKEKAGLSITKKKTKTDEIVISGHPQGFYEWDEEIYKTKGIGGSETACVEMAHWLAKLTNRKVIVFNNRTSSKEFGNVKYLPASECPQYFGENEPKAHIAWRHNVKLTDAPTYLWCHDLVAQGMEVVKHYEKVFALSDFHKHFIHSMAGVPLDKIWVTRNGINPKRFFGACPPKEKGRVIFSSSPDRGLENAMRVMDLVVKEFPGAKLHAYYGMDNLVKAGRQDVADKITKEIKLRSYVNFHGNVTQEELTYAMQLSEVWLYPTNFLETYCITAIEALCCNAYPVVRNYGALKDTLLQAKINRMATLIDSDCVTEAEVKAYAGHVLDALFTKKHSVIEVDVNTFSWENVAKDWIEFLKI